MQSDEKPEATEPRSGRAAESAIREAQRKKRLVAALRDNLRRRKAPRPDEPSPDDDGR